MKIKDLYAKKTDKLDITIPIKLQYVYGCINKMGMDKYGATVQQWIDTVGEAQAQKEAIDSALRHLAKYQLTESDAESGLSHLWHAFYSLGMAIQATDIELDF